MNNTSLLTLRTVIKVICALILLVVFYIIFFDSKNTVDVPALENPIVENNENRMCFFYDQPATLDAPYEVHEKIDITVVGNLVTGTKSGTQKGPDMTNGYEGTLAGEFNDPKIDVIFSYIIEGSSQKEKEYYELRNGDLVKFRYVLKEEDGILVRDISTSSVREIVYHKIDCIN